jgi:hypothetical protein
VYAQALKKTIADAVLVVSVERKRVKSKFQPGMQIVPRGTPAVGKK